MLGVAMLIFGVTEGIGTVIWGTLLQRRVPRHLLGRISSLDFFVSLALMPVSMALAGPIAEVVPIWLIFFIGGLACPIMAFVALFAARMMKDEIENPLDSSAVDTESADTQPDSV
jgi:MFS family permease